MKRYSLFINILIFLPFLSVNSIELFTCDSVRIRESFPGNVSGLAIFVNAKDVCEGIPNPNIIGMVMVVKDEECFTHNQIIYAEQNGAVGFVLARQGNFGGLGSSYDFTTPPHGGFNIPAAEIGYSDSDFLLQLFVNQIPFQIHLEPRENPYENLPWWIFPVVLIPLSTILIAIATHKLFFFISPDGKPPSFRKFLERLSSSLPVIILISQIIALLIIFIWSIDPFGVYNLFGRQASEILLSLNVPIFFISLMLVSYVWNEALRAIVLPVSDLMKKLKIPLILFVIVMFATELAASISRAIYLSPPSGYGAFNILTYLIITVVTSIYFLVTGVRLLRSISNSSTNLDSKRKGNAKRMGGWIFLIIITSYIAIFSIIMLIVMALYFKSAFNSPVGFVCVFFIMQSVKLSSALGFINIFETPRIKTESSDLSLNRISVSLQKE